VPTRTGSSEGPPGTAGRFGENSSGFQRGDSVDQRHPFWPRITGCAKGHGQSSPCLPLRICAAARRRPLRHGHGIRLGRTHTAGHGAIGRRRLGDVQYSRQYTHFSPTIGRRWQSSPADAQLAGCYAGRGTLLCGLPRESRIGPTGQDGPGFAQGPQNPDSLVRRTTRLQFHQGSTAGPG